MGVKVTVVGGGSTYTPELVEGLAARSDRVTIDELVLLDPDSERLEPVGGLARRILDRTGWRGSLVLTGDQDRALDGADFVVVQLRIGGQRARLSDETLPLRFGCIGQETTGPGGFAKALRTVPVVLDIADAVTRRAARGAWLVDFTNPTGIVTQALLDHGHRALGLCNVAIGFQRRFAAWMGVEPDRVQLDHVGLNHLSWVRAVVVDGRDRLPELLEEHGGDLADEVGLPVDVLRTLRAVPSYYLRYHYATDEVLGEERTHPPRAEEVMRIEAALLEAYRDPSLNRKPELLEQRGGAYYSEAAAGLIASLCDGRGDVQVVDALAGAAVPGMPPDAVVEIPAAIDRDGAHPIPMAPMSPDMLGLVQAVKAYERLTVEAALTGDRRVALLALVANPLVRQWSVAESLLDALLEANRHHLPRFFGDGSTAG
jgi:6-phospho-beta-glucosidase